MRTHLYTLLCFLILPISITAQSNCEAPAPSQISIVESGNDYLVVDWSAVPGAQSYLVTVTHPVSETTVTVQQTSAVSFTVTGLEPGENYQIVVQASYCTDGPYGAEGTIEGKTTIIIVDVVFQLKCNRGTTIVSSGYKMGETMEVVVPSSRRVSYFVEGSIIVQPGSPGVPFRLMMQNVGSKRLSLVYGHGSTPDFRVIHKGPASGQFRYATELWEDFFQLSTKTLTDGDIYASFHWTKDVQVELSSCTSWTTHKSAGGVSPLRGYDPPIEASSVSIFPNPAQEVLTLNLGSAGYYEVWDVTGRLHHRETVEHSGQHKLLIGGFQRGVYLLRWFPVDREPTVKQFLKIR